MPGLRQGKQPSGNAMDGLTIGLIVGVTAAGVLLAVLLAFTIFKVINRKKRRDCVMKDLAANKSLRRSSTDPSIRKASNGAGKYHSMALPSGAPNGSAYSRASLPGRGSIIEPFKENTVYATASSQELGFYEREISETSTSEDDGEIDAGPGKLWFTLSYREEEETLKINVLKAKYSQGRDRNQSPCDSFVKVFLLPDEKSSQQSQTVKKTVLLRFNETFKFKVQKEEIRTRTVRISLYDLDTRSIRHCEGHVLCPLEDVDLVSRGVICNDFGQCSQTPSLGQIFFSLTYMPSTEKIKLVIMRGQGLPKNATENGTCVYVKVQIIQGRKTMKTKKTSDQYGAEPVFNECFSFSINNKSLEQCSIVVSMMTKDAKVKDNKNGETLFGKCTVGSFMYARGDQLQHWQEMLTNARTPIARWHTLITT